MTVNMTRNKIEMRTSKHKHLGGRKTQMTTNTYSSVAHPYWIARGRW